MKNAEHWWSNNWGTEYTCGITHTRLRPGKNKNGVYYTTKLKCNHRFCTNPLLEWVKNCPDGRITCPVCRQTFELQDMIRP